ncbi:MAG: YfhO family protein, partial [Polyangia bacterium]
AAALWVRRPSLALCAIAMHLAAEGWIVQPLVPRDAVTRKPALLEPIAATSPRPRIYRLPGLTPRSNAQSPVEASIAQRDTGLENNGAPFGFAHVPGYEPALEARWHAVWDAGAATGARVLERFDVQWVILPSALAARTPFVARAELGGVVLAENQRRRPRAFVATRWRFGGDDETRAALFDPAHADELQLAGSGAPSTGGGAITPCALTSPRPEQVELRCDAPADGYAVLLDAFADGWSATVDGAPAPILRADLVVRAVPLGAGTHTVAMRYRTPGLRSGALVSLVAWLALIAWLAAARRRAGISATPPAPARAPPSPAR